MQKLSIQNKKILVTNEMLNTFPEKSRYDLRTAFIKWWINSTKTGGLRLTSTGFKILEGMQYINYPFKVKRLTVSSNLLILDQKLECPYYIDKIGAVESKITIFGDKEATIIKLFGNFQTFLKSL
jgi:hypothetical protein